MHYSYIEIRATSGSALLDDKCTVRGNNALNGGSGIGKLTSNFHDNVIVRKTEKNIGKAGSLMMKECPVMLES